MTSANCTYNKLCNTGKLSIILKKITKIFKSFTIHIKIIFAKVVEDWEKKQYSFIENQAKKVITYQSAKVELLGTVKDTKN